MIIVTGLGRCGTSILTKYLGECGYGLGKNVNWHDKARAGLELSTAYSLNQDMWISCCHAGKPIDLTRKYRGSYWDGMTYKEVIQNVDKDEERQGKIEVWKDPRFTWNPELIEAWWSVRQDIKLIICHRDIQSIYNSRKSLPEQYDDPKRKEIEEYKVDFADFITKVLQLNIPYMFLFYPHFLLEINETVMKLKEFGLEKTDSKILEGLVDRSLLNENE